MTAGVESQYAIERKLMIEQQVRARGVRDEAVLSVMREIARHAFVPPESVSVAYTDQPLSIGFGQTISQPYIVALMTSRLGIRREHRVLEIGTGCGYQTAILARLAGEVCTVEVLEVLSRRAEKTLKEMGIENVSYHVGDGWNGWPEGGVFDRILVAAAAEDVPTVLLDQLAEGGRLIVPVDSTVGQELKLIEKHKGQLKETSVCHCRFVRLIHVE